MAKIEYLNESDIKKLVRQTIKEINSGVRDKEYQRAIGNGLYIIVELNGKAYYRIRPTIKSKRTWINVGDVDLDGLANIRIKASEYKKELRDSGNLLSIKEPSINILTINDLCTEYRQIVPIIRKTKESILSITYSINTIQKHIGEVKLSELTGDIIEDNILKPKANSIPAMRKDFKTLRQMLDYAVQRKQISANPALNIASPLLKAKHSPRRLVLTEADLAKLFGSLYELDHIPFKFKVAIHLLFLLLVRRMELLSSHWGQIDLENGTLNLDKNKTDAPTIIPLPRQAIAIFKLMQKNPEIFGEPTGYLFKGKRRGGFVAENSINVHMAKLKEVIGKDLSPHATRRTASSILHKMKFDIAVVESALNHSKKSLDSIWAVYNLHDYYQERQEMLRVWADKIDSYIPKNVKEDMAKLM